MTEWAKYFEFDLCDDPQLEALVRASANFLRDVRERKKRSLLVMLGKSDNGKSHLARKVFKWWWKTGRWFTEPETGCNIVMSGQFCYWPGFVKECKQGEFSRGDDLENDKFVVLDDIITAPDAHGKIADWQVEMLCRIIEARINPKIEPGDRSPIHAATIITANMSLKDIASAYDPRIASRLLRLDKQNLVQVETKQYQLRGKE